MNQQPNSRQNFDIDDSLLSEAQIAQAGGNLSQIQNINVYSVLNLAGLLRSRQINPSNKQDYNSRKILLNKVKQYWIKDVLEKSLHSKALIELGLEERLDAVKRPSEIAQENSSDLRKPLPQYKKNINIFREMDEGRTLLILGEPGAGKTTFLLRIVKSLVADTEENLSLPIPVIFNLSSWANKRKNITQWLIQELVSNYKVSKSLARHWIQNQQLLLLLDGLDEVKTEYRDACVKALNEFMQNYGETEIVVCSRVKDYESLSNRLAIQRGVCIQSLTTEQINDYLDRAGNQLQAVKTLLETDTALQELVKSPLMLNIITLVYKNVTIEDLPQVDSVEEHRQHLFNSYIQRMFARRSTNKVYPEEKARNWLNWLAYKMSQNSQTIFSIEQMQPRWLETGWQKVIYHIGVILFSSFTISIIGLLIFELCSLILLKKSSSKQDFYESFTSFVVPSLFWGISNFINNKFSNKEEIFFHGQPFIGARKKAFKEIFFGIKNGLIFGVCLSLYIIIIGIQEGSINWLLSTDDAFRGELIGFLSIIIKLTIIFLVFSLVFGFTFSVYFGIIGAVADVQDSVNRQKEIISVNPVKKTLLNSIILAVIGGLLLVLTSFAGSYFLNGRLSLLGKEQEAFVFLTIIFGSFSGQVVGFACIQHFILRLTLYKYKYIPWNYTHFLEYATERIFLQKVGGGYIFVHRLLLEHFAALYQPCKLSFNTRSNLLITRKYRIFSVIITSILITLLGYQFRKEGEKYVQGFVEYLKSPSRQIDWYNSQIQKGYKTAGNYYRRGDAYLKKKRYDLAIADYSQAIKLDPKYIDAYLYRGLAYNAKGQYDLAIADYSKVIKSDPKNMVAYARRGDAYYNKKQYDQAIADYNQAIKLDPKYIDAYYKRGGVYKNQGSKNKAIDDFKKVLELNKNSYLSKEASKQLQELSTF